MKHALRLFLISCLIVSCTKKTAQTPPQMIPEVTVVKVSPRTIPIVKEFVGQMSGIRDIQVRARVGGILLKRYYREGAKVKAGDLLFKIDPAPYQALLEQAQGEVSVNQARFTNSRQSLNRILPLYKENAVSQKDRDDAVADFNSSKSSLERAKAKLEEAKINLGYTTVSAPINGYTSKETVSEGSLIVVNSDQSLLTTISQIDPAYVNFSYTDNELLELRRLSALGKLSRPVDMTKLEVQVRLGDNSIYPQKGFMNFNDNIIDSTTGTVKARAIIDNPDGYLKPGQFVRVYVSGFSRTNTIAVPSKSIIQTQNGPIVFAVNSESKVQQVNIETGEEIGSEVVVNKGLRGGEYVVVEGAAKVRNGMQVKIVSGSTMAKANSIPVSLPNKEFQANTKY
ncbi:efflux RND transporter periplasmic adaptor subunit [Bdellovibrio svalbardensis]|uniref:Efflux RND transporter periplasmic adaptor subunit n=1 Tax=Bdellovibrio svalbardensis TaxID=2972972 RepID=A0ABT6DMT2_9BACT|nr:efflux RND transporter periplasmic adaptor subunit [Bdellovibrio svalbardensis]MDG0817817.1 efflux RND transporter periplasmic adaptor subunit [Bdellovibrio svalbardensis]